MIKEDDLILAEKAMEKSIEKIGYLLSTISGKKIISSISVDDILKKAEKESFNYLLIFCDNEKNALNKIKIEKLKKKVNKDFMIYIATEDYIKEYKI